MTLLAGQLVENVPVRNMIAGAVSVHRHSNAAIVIGADTGAPPIPAMFTWRTKAVDIVHNLALLQSMPPG